jgi:sulfatase modifying factor 1
MKIVTPLLLLGLVGCGTLTVPRERREETIAIPGTKIRVEMVYVAGGALRPFWISKREVTWGDFDRFYEFPEDEKLDGVTRPSAGKNYLMLSGLPPEFLDPGRPVTNLRHHSAMAYCEWLSRRSGALFRLPTEPEWELACGRATAPLGEQAWFQDNSGEQTHATGGKKPNALGLYDMLGNVWEYCLESYALPGFEPVLRGGAWNSPAGHLDSAFRKTLPPEWSDVDPSRPYSTWWFRGDHSQGFRVVRVPEAADSRLREAYAAKIEIRGLQGREHPMKSGPSTLFFSRVTGEVRNGGGRPLEELGLKVYYRDPKGKPHLEDVASPQTRRATFNTCWPVLVNSAHAGGHSRALLPGEWRAFSVDVPLTFDGADDVQPDSFGAAVVFLKFGGD